MKLSLFFTLMVLTASSLLGDPSPDIPSIDVRTDSQGSHTWQGTDSAGWKTKQISKSISVRVGLRSFHPPSEPYRVECFFIARNQANEDYIFNIQRKTSSAVSDTLIFEAPSLFGGSSSHLSIPISLAGGGPNFFTGSLELHRSQPGSRFYGWIVRVISKGTVVRLESNQAVLKISAQKNPTLFDKAAAQ